MKTINNVNGIPSRIRASSTIESARHQSVSSDLSGWPSFSSRSSDISNGWPTVSDTSHKRSMSSAKKSKSHAYGSGNSDQLNKVARMFNDEVKDKHIVLDSTWQDRYECGRVLGSGLTASVSLCYDKSNNTSFALKHIKKFEGTGRKNESLMADSLHKELELMLKLKHQFIVSYQRAFFDDENEVYVVMELVDGVSGNDLMAEAGNNSLLDGMIMRNSDFWTVSRQLFSALEYMHENNAVHRDIKMDNIIFARSYPCLLFTAKLIDLGFACAPEGSPDMACPTNSGDLRHNDVVALGRVLLTFVIGHKTADHISEAPEEFQEFLTGITNYNQDEALTAHQAAEIARAAEVRTGVEESNPPAVMPSIQDIQKLQNVIENMADSMADSNFDEVERLMAEMQEGMSSFGESLSGNSYT
jgi:tRNA A-37 threonylcarbamoyl transferase component Bud32